MYLYNKQDKIEYTNKAKHYVEIDGQYVEMYTPFVIFAGTYFKNETVQNVKVTTGKAVDDGSKTIVIGMALPGLQESLGLDSTDFSIPKDIEIEMDIKVGEKVRIVSGPFAEFVGDITEVYPDKAKLRAMVSIFGRETPVELEYKQIQKL